MGRIVLLFFCFSCIASPAKAEDGRWVWITGATICQTLEQATDLVTKLDQYRSSLTLPDGCHQITSIGGEARKVWQSVVGKAETNGVVTHQLIKFVIPGSSGSILIGFSFTTLGLKT